MQPNSFIRLLAEHKVAANLIMVLMVLAGIWALKNLNYQLDPDQSRPWVFVNVAWPAAGAEDVERLVTTPMEQALKNINGLADLYSTTENNYAHIEVHFENGTNSSWALDSVKQAVSQVRNLPPTIEPPRITLFNRTEPVASILLTGAGSAEELIPIAREMEKELLALGLDEVIFRGLPKEELAIEVSSSKLRELNISLYQLANKIRSLSRDVPSGIIGQGQVSRQLRSLDQQRDSKGFKQLPLTNRKGESLISLGDVATIVLRPVANQVTLTQEGKAGVELSVVRMADTDLLDASSILEGWVEKTRATLSPGTEIYLYSEAKKFMLDMTNIILRNGLSGLCLVILVLYVFLNGRVAWWVMIGIPVSFMGAFALYLLVGDGSLNSVMMIALVMSIGIVVDDAIVVGEDTLTFHEAGYSAADAAVAGAGRMFSPVIASSATTAAAFIPVIIVAWQEPVIMILPLTVVCVILASLAECFLVLPGHLRHSYEVMKAGRVDSFRNRFDTAFKDFRDNKFKPLLHWALTNRAATLAVAISALAIALSLLASGRVSINLTTGLNFEYAEANIQFNSGATQAVRENYLRQLEESLKQADQQFEDAAFVTFITRHNYARLGEDRKAGEEFASLFVELTPPEDRAFTNEEFAAEWRKLAPVSAYVTSAQIEAMGGRRKGGPELTLTLRGNDVGTLKLAAEELEEVLSRYPGVTNVFDNLPYGKEQWILSMTIEGRALGLSVESIGRQLRAAYDGERVQIFNGRYDELEVRLMLPEAERQSLTSLKTFPIMTEQGEMIPMATVATIASRKGIDIIKHWKTQQMVSVSANVDTTINTSGRILADLEKAELKQILAKYNLDYGLGGRSAEEAKMLSMMGLGALLGLVLIYIVLVWVFASYTWPLAIMTAIPLGITGAIAGHWIMGMHISAMSMLAVFTLTGVVVNDSIVLISFYKEKRAEGLPVQQCLLEASCERLRAIVLTSLTTIVGLSPLIFESAPIASYLIPLAVTMVFGMGYASVLVLFVIPTLLSAIESMNVERARWIGRMMVRLLPESANA